MNINIQLSKVGIANLIRILGDKTYELFKLRGLKDYSAQSLAKLIVNLHGENDALRDKLIRDNLINTFKDKDLNDFLTLKVSWYLPDSMWRRTFLENKELFDEKLFKGQDRDFHTRMLMRNPKIELVDQYLTYYRRHEKSISDTVSISVIKSLFDSLNKRIRLLKNQYLNKEIHECKVFFLNWN